MSTLTVGTISEKVTDAGVAIDGVTLKDGGATLTSDITATNSSGNLTVGIITGTSNSSIINLGDTDASNVGQVKYHHGVNSMVLRTNSTDKVTLDSTGNMLFNQSGTGIYLGTTSASASNLLDDYEEGTHSFTEISGQASITTNRGNYTKIGRLVMLHASVTVGSNTNNNTLNLSLPFASTINGFFLGGGNVSFTTLSTSDYVVNNLRVNIENQATDVRFIYNANSEVTCANASGKRIDFFCTYHVE